MRGKGVGWGGFACALGGTWAGLGVQGLYMGWVRVGGPGGLVRSWVGGCISTWATVP